MGGGGGMQLGKGGTLDGGCHKGYVRDRTDALGLLDLAAGQSVKEEGGRSGSYAPSLLVYQ